MYKRLSTGFLCIREVLFFLRLCRQEKEENVAFVHDLWSVAGFRASHSHYELKHALRRGVAGLRAFIARATCLTPQC